MDLPFGARVKQAWNAFMDKDNFSRYRDIGPGYYRRPDRPMFTRGNERSIVTSVFNRIAIDAASINLRHVRLDENDRFLETLDTGLNNCLSVEANTDQTGRAFVQDAVMSMLDEGCIAIVPVDTTGDPNSTGAYDINSMLMWHLRQTKIHSNNERRIYRERTH